MIKWSVIWFMASLLAAYGGLEVRPSGGLPSLRLLDGTRIAGDLEQQEMGYFLRQPHGGRLLRWSAIDPASLPPLVRSTQRERALASLYRGQALYDAGDPLAARPYFERTFQLRHYLQEADRDLAPYAHLDYKRRGWIKAEGEWISYVAYQRQQGYVYYGGRWLPEAQAVELKAFRRAAARAKQASTVAEVSWPLEQVLAEYPKSRYAEAARHLQERLTAKIEAETERQQELADLAADRREARERGWDREDDGIEWERSNSNWLERRRNRWEVAVSQTLSARVFGGSRGAARCETGGNRTVIVIQR